MTFDGFVRLTWQFTAAAAFGIWQGNFSAGLWMFGITNLAVYLRDR